MVGDQRREPVLQHVGVDLRGRDVGVAEQFLDDAQIRAVGEKVAREGVAEHVGRDLGGGNAEPGRECLEIAPEGLPGHVPLGRGGGKGEAAAGMAAEVFSAAR